MIQYCMPSANISMCLEKLPLAVNVVVLNCCGVSECQVCLNPQQEVRDQVIDEAATWPQVRLQLMFESRECQYIFIENVICRIYDIQNPQQEYLLFKSAVSKKCVITDHWVGKEGHLFTLRGKSMKKLWGGLGGAFEKMWHRMLPLHILTFALTIKSLCTFKFVKQLSKSKKKENIPLRKM